MESNKKQNKIKVINGSEDLARRYGELGTEKRNKFHNEALSWYYGSIFKDRRKELKLTQKQLAEKINQPIAYVARMEKGEQKMDISQFIKLIDELDMEIKPIDK